jgi:hypothetical protein
MAVFLTALTACFAVPARGQIVVPTTDVKMVPAVPYEPIRLRPLAPPTPAIVQASHQEPTPPTPAPTPPPVEFTEAAHDNVYRCWARLDFLSWWISRPPIGVPLVTSNTPPAIGAIGEPGTTVLFGSGSGQQPSFGAFAGTKITIGGWLEKNYDYGWEFGGFVLERRSSTFNASSAGGAAANLSIPFNATDPFAGSPAGESSLNSGGAPSNATVHLTSQLWGFELNELAYVGAGENWYVTIVLGARYLNMNENLTLNYTNFDTITGGNLAVIDGFGTHNQFFAGQLGCRTGGTLGRFTFDTAAMLMCGPMRQVLNVAGATTVTGTAFGFADGTTNAGLFAEPSNIGNHTRGVIAVGTELQMKMGYAITRNIQPYVAYNALFINNVARPGQQIDRNVNVTQQPFFVPPGTLTGTISPLAAIRGSDLWVHGVQLGIELRY